MCGIVGSIGKHNPRQYLINGLETLEYRGYDSAGIAYLNTGIKVIKDVGTISHLDSITPSDIDSSVAIGHTRWATHGGVNIFNTHPHLSFHEQFALVHNGVIENYSSIKEMLKKEGFVFKSDTDSEVVVNLVEYYYLKCNDVLKAIKKTLEEVKGSYAIALIHILEEKIYILKNNSPLLIGICDDCYLLASDASPMIEYTDKFIDVGDLEYGVISKDGYQLFDNNGHILTPEIIKKDVGDVKHDKKGFPHYMLKEIYEINDVMERMITEYFAKDGYRIPFDITSLIKESDHIIFVACGTSYHACLIGARYFEELGFPCSVYIASEWAFNPVVHGKKPLFIYISQSGETGDLIHSIKISNEKNFPSILLTNTIGSTLESLATHTLYLYAGVEVSVASTKAYVAEVLLLLLLAKSFEGDTSIRKEILSASSLIKRMREEHLDRIKEIAKKIRNNTSVFYLGRGCDFYLSLEASLKLKEISYIHSEAIPGGELKHGPISLIENNIPVIVFISDSRCASMMRGNIEEVKSRGADVHVFSTRSLARKSDDVIVDDFPIYLSPIIMSTFAFLLAYYVSLYKGLNVDKPRNLAKSVTVE